MPGKQGKQTVKKGIWHIGGRSTLRKRNQKGGAIPPGLLASLTRSTYLGRNCKTNTRENIRERVKKKKDNIEILKNGKKAHNFKKKSKSSANKPTKRKIFCLKMGENKHKTTSYKYKSNKKQDNQH